MGNTFLKLLEKEMQGSVEEVYNYSGTYLSYSLSSSTDSLKAEPYLICASENNDYVKVGMINAYKSVHWGSGIISNHQNSYLMFNGQHGYRRISENGRQTDSQSGTDTGRRDLL